MGRYRGDIGEILEGEHAAAHGGHPAPEHRRLEHALVWYRGVDALRLLRQGEGESEGEGEGEGGGGGEGEGEGEEGSGERVRGCACAFCLSARCCDGSAVALSQKRHSHDEVLLPHSVRTRVRSSCRLPGRPVSTGIAMSWMRRLLRSTSLAKVRLST